MKLSFKLFYLTVYSHCMVLLTQDGVQNGCQIIICLKVCFSHSIIWLLKQVMFDNSLVKKAIQTFMLPICSQFEGSKHTIQEIGQRSNECKL